MFKKKEKATPRQLRRIGYLVAAIAVWVVVFSIYREIDYASFEKSAARVDARITRLEAIKEGRRYRYILHYAIDLGGRSYAYKDESGKTTRLEELYTGTFNAFTGEDPPLATGKTFGVLVNPKQPEDHRPDRDKLSLPSALWLVPVIGVSFLSAVAAFLLWVGRESPSAASARPHGSRKSRVSSSRSDGRLKIDATIDVPWPAEPNPEDVVQQRLRARMRELQAERGEVAEPAPSSGPRASSIELEVELRPEQDAQLYEARVDFLGPSGERATEVITRALELRSGHPRAFAATLTPPAIAVKLRLVLVLADRTTFEHELPL
jgi:hypothetical protein